MNPKHDIIEDVVKRFNHLSTRGLARYILGEYGGLFDNDYEKIRSAIRYIRGENGDKSRLNNPTIIAPSKPEVMPDTWRVIRTPFHLNPGKWLILADAHIPFHERVPIEAAIKYGKKRKVTGILFNGDMQDCQAVTFWPSTIRKKFTEEMQVFIQFLDFVRQEFPNEEIVYKPGNHEYRLPRYYASHCPELMNHPILAMESLIDFEGRGIEFLDYHQMVMAGKLPIIHGHEVRVIGRAVNPARGLFLKTKTWAMCSHLHTTSEHTSTNIHQEYLTTWSTGCLCDLAPDYNPMGNDWNHGAGIIEVLPNGDFFVDNFRILKSGKIV